MNVFTLFIITAAFGAEPLELAGSSWIQIAGPESAETIDCPIELIFEESKYTYVNRCTGGGRNKIVEFGRYSADIDSMWFDDRRVLVGARSILGDDAQSVLIDLVEIDESVMRFQVGTLIIFLAKKH